MMYAHESSCYGQSMRTHLNMLGQRGFDSFMQFLVARECTYTWTIAATSTSSVNAGRALHHTSHETLYTYAECFYL